TSSWPGSNRSRRRRSVINSAAIRSAIPALLKVDEPARQAGRAHRLAYRRTSLRPPRLPAAAPRSSRVLPSGHSVSLTDDLILRARATRGARRVGELTDGITPLLQSGGHRGGDRRRHRKGRGGNRSVRSGRMERWSAGG